MSTSNAIIIHLLFCILAIVLATGVLWLTYSAALFDELFSVYGAGDPERMSAIHREGIVYVLVAWPALIIHLYLIYYGVNKKYDFALASAIAAGFLYIISVLPDRFSENWPLLIGYVIAMTVLILIGMSLPRYTIRRLKHKNMSVGTA